MTELATKGFDQTQALIDVLTALEYGTKKEESDVIAPVLETYNLKPIKKSRLAEAVVKTPGFERFFLDVLKQVRPFSLMLADIYAFLNSNQTTTSRRASKVFVQSEKAKAELKFDLQNFPKEVLKTINEIKRFGSIVELRFDGLDLSEPVPQWNDSQAEKDWSAVSPVWDNDFYDNGFHRILSYGQGILNNADPKHIQEANEIVRPILDRLAAICDYIDGLLSPDRSLFGRTATFSTRPVTTEVLIGHNAARSHLIEDPTTATQLLHAVRTSWRNAPTTVLDELYNEFRAFAISANVWESATLRRGDDDWIRKRFDQTLLTISPEEYLDALRDSAVDYVRKLDRVAPVVDTYSYQETIESFLEFIGLPFWKHRWFLYELWTLTRTLEIAGRVASVELRSIQESKEGILDWKLPGGTAQLPVAAIGDGARQVYCWTQRKTYHPGTAAGLEPDLRLTTRTPPYHDILIIENKDRLTTRPKPLREILDRYVGGTCAESVWLVNYEKFPESATLLEDEWPGRKIHILSNFRPGFQSIDLEHEVEEILRRNIFPSSHDDDHSVQDAKERTDSSVPMPASIVQAKLTWGALPRDLDLHAWVTNSSGHHHISYGEMGSLDVSPYAKLDRDDRAGNGEETVEIQVRESESITIAVQNYSKEAPLSQSGATVKVRRNGTHDTLLHVPNTGSGEWWHVVLIHCAKGTFEILHQLSDTPPSSS
jgi:hypothetical protein